MKTALEKELEKRTMSVEQEQEKMLDNVKLLLSSKEAEERDFLNRVGLNREAEYFERVDSEAKFRKKSAEKYKSLVVTKAELEKFCKDYCLVVRSPRNYVGKMPADCGVVLARFCKDNDIVLSHDPHYNRNQFKVVAPPKMFDDYKNPFKEVANHVVFNFPAEAKAAFLKAVEPDPMLVYAIPDSDNWAVIQSWGNDETLTRRFLGWFYNSGAYTLLTSLLVIFVPALLTILAWQGTNFLYDAITPVHEHPFVDDSNRLTTWGFIHIVLQASIVIFGGFGVIFFWFSDVGFKATLKVIKNFNFMNNIWG